MALINFFPNMLKKAKNNSSPLSMGRGRKQKSLERAEDAFAEGVFFEVSLDRYHEPKLVRSASTESLSTTGSSTTPCSTPTASPPASSTSWQSTETTSFYRGQPLLVNDPESSVELKDEAEALGVVMQRSRQLPGTWYYSSNHILVNNERTKRIIAPLTRLRELDEIASQHAKAMAEAATLFHSDPVDLRARFNRPSRLMGENVARGESIRDIHQKMMITASDKFNILHRRYSHMGMATAPDADGQLYLCQVFRG